MLLARLVGKIEKFLSVEKFAVKKIPLKLLSTERSWIKIKTSRYPNYTHVEPKYQLTWIHVCATEFTFNSSDRAIDSAATDPSDTSVGIDNGSTFDTLITRDIII